MKDVMIRDSKGRFVNVKGVLNPFYGKKHTLEARRKMSINHWSKRGISPWNKGLSKETNVILRKVSEKVSHTLQTKRFGGKNIIQPSYALGYFSGLVLGDGYVDTKCIYVNSTKMELIKLFSNAAKDIHPSLRPIIDSRVVTRTFPNGKKRTDIQYRCRVYSKLLAKFLKQYKLDDYKWCIPEIFSNKESKLGFLRGIYDAEGCVTRTIKNNWRGIRIIISSKHKENLEQVQKILQEFGIVAYIQNGDKCYNLTIASKENVIKFYKKINFGLERKAKKLKELIGEYYGG